MPALMVFRWAVILANVLVVCVVYSREGPGWWKDVVVFTLLCVSLYVGGRVDQRLVQ